MAIDSDDVLRIAREEEMGSEPARPDTPAEARFRLKVREQIRDIRARGGVVDLPFDP